MKKIALTALFFVTACGPSTAYMYRSEFRNPDTNEISRCDADQPSQRRMEESRQMCRQVLPSKGFTELVKEEVTTMPADEYYKKYSNSK